MRRVAVIAFAVTALVACSSGKDTPKTGGETFTSERTTTTAATNGPTTYAEFGDYVNGRHIAFVKTFDQASIGFDVVQFLTGDAAIKAYDEDTGSNEPPDNDYYVRNQNPLVRTLPLADAAVIRVNTAGGYEPTNTADGHEVNRSTFESYFKAGTLQHAYFWLTIKDGTVTAIEEQFVP